MNFETSALGLGHSTAPYPGVGQLALTWGRGWDIPKGSTRQAAASFTSPRPHSPPSGWRAAGRRPARVGLRLHRRMQFPLSHRAVGRAWRNRDLGQNLWQAAGRTDAHQADKREELRMDRIAPGGKRAEGDGGRGHERIPTHVSVRTSLAVQTSNNAGVLCDACEHAGPANGRAQRPAGVARPQRCGHWPAGAKVGWAWRGLGRAGLYECGKCPP
jgi:hypothetical protein